MKAFHGDAAVKANYLARLQAHHAADEIIQGTGWENGHGCAVGCTLNKYDHLAYEHELGLPQWLARLEDRIFEGLPAGEAQQFAVDFLTAVPVGADVSEVRFKLASQRLHRERVRHSGNSADYAKQCVAAIDQVIAYCDATDRTEAQRESAAESARSAWSAARSAARSAESAARSAWSAAWSAESAESAAESAWSAARSAARSAESAAESAWSAARSAESAAESAWSAAWSAESAAESAWSAASNHYRFEAATLLQLLREAPVLS